MNKGLPPPVLPLPCSCTGGFSRPATDESTSAAPVGGCIDGDPCESVRGGDDRVDRKLCVISTVGEADESAEGDVSVSPADPDPDADAEAPPPAPTCAPVPPANSPPPMAGEENIPTLNTLSTANGSSKRDRGGCAAAVVCEDANAAFVGGEDCDEVKGGGGAGPVAVTGADGSSLNPGGAGAAVAVTGTTVVAGTSARVPLLKNGMENMDDDEMFEPADVVRASGSCLAACD